MAAMGDCLEQGIGKEMRTRPSSPLTKRQAGILLHPTSLPGVQGHGTLGREAYRFADFLTDCGITVWQTLPLGPTHADLSPYQCTSVHAGSASLIDLELLVEQGWLDGQQISAGADRRALLVAAFQGFLRHAPAQEQDALGHFNEQHAGWLDDYGLYIALKQKFNDSAWTDWPAELRDREPAALRGARTGLHEVIEQARFEQFLFHRQWQDLKGYANGRGIQIFGDMPIFVAHDSAEVWAQREYFALDEEGKLEVVAGVPPDYFSATGQLWGNPHYRWDRMEADGFAWWVDRIKTHLHMFDMVRIDHFRGFESYWEVPAGHDTAIQGRWVKAPGDALFMKLRKSFNPLPLLAEDLGVITPEVDALRKKHRLPGMKILQFAFDGGPDNPYLPHAHHEDSVVYTGTHDNDTTRGWYDALSDDAQRYVQEYLGVPSEPMPWALIRCALASVARLAIVPLQDVLMLDSTHRMNTPGTTQGNWRWRFTWEQVPDGTVERLRRLIELYGRLTSK